MGNSRVLDVLIDQGVERKLHQQPQLEFTQDLQRVSRLLRPRFAIAEPPKERMQIPSRDEVSNERQRLALVGSQIPVGDHGWTIARAPRSSRPLLAWRTKPAASFVAS